jgi:hypothetical protein
VRNAAAIGPRSRSTTVYRNGRGTAAEPKTRLKRKASTNGRTSAMRIADRSRSRCRTSLPAIAKMARIVTP